MVILGGGSVAAEFAHVFSSLGVQIHIVTKAPTLLETLDAEISRRFTSKVAGQWDLHLGGSVTGVQKGPGGISVSLENGTRVSAELLLVATGRKPNTDGLGLELAGVTCRDDGRIVVDDYGMAAPGIWAVGDVSSPFELKHVANAEARTVAHNLSHPEDLRVLPHEWVPSAVFTEPEIASVGARSQDLEGKHYVEAVQSYGDTAYGWALQDHDGICKLYADPGCRHTSGCAHPGAIRLTLDHSIDPGSCTWSTSRRYGARPVLDPSRFERGGGECSLEASTGRRGARRPTALISADGAPPPFMGEPGRQPNVRASEVSLRCRVLMKTIRRAPPRSGSARRWRRSRPGRRSP
jgi:hypothetical protein